MTKTIVRLAALLLLALPSLTGLQLPARGPLPDKRPESAAPSPDAVPRAEEQAKEPAELPTPQTRPRPSAADPAKPDQTERKPEAAPGQDNTRSKPQEPSSDVDGSKTPPSDRPGEPAKDPESAEQQPPPDPAPQPEEPKALTACLADLKAIGASFEQRAGIDDDGGCGIAAPIAVTKLLPDVTLEPEATLRCETALQLARMTRDMLKPAAESAFPDKPKLTGIRHASAYVCRNRNSAENGKVSEHAYGNAIDIAGLRFGEGEQPVIIARQDDGTAEAAFQRAFNAIACLYFTTVLSPGSDPTHQDHMHLDVIERKSGFRYCR